jgi:tRNA 5-methylaminomethyl-2-thiouridine biosynthesis bifunctional protein
VARLVRDGLQGAGFSFNTLPGYGRTREMLVAEKTSPAVTESNPEVAKQRCEPPWYLNLNSAPATREVTVIGGGIAGCSTAAALAKRGLKVTLVERHGQLGAEASGNPQGILYPKLSLEDLALSLYARQAVCHAISLYQPLFDQGEFGEQCGVLALPVSDKDKARCPFIAER